MKGKIERMLLSGKSVEGTAAKLGISIESVLLVSDYVENKKRGRKPREPKRKR